jgi:hypothetical protein
VSVTDSVVKRLTDSETMTQPPTNKQITTKTIDSTVALNTRRPMGHSVTSLTQQPVALKGNHHHLSTTITMDVSTVLMNKFIFRNSMTR